eukprot:m.30996 g.30996  ORF g.30996 m.30996 type:complete len:163 (+) comp12024_c0_seq3:104-592(+)
MAKRAWQLAKGVYREIFVLTKPLPNPEWYKPIKIDTSIQGLIQLFKRTNKAYLDTWREETDEESKRKKQQKFERDVTEQKQALQTISEEGTSLATASRDSMKSMIQDGIHAYHLSVKAFVEGYKEATAKTDASSIMDAFVAGSGQEKASTPSKEDEPSAKSN